jgi:molecular chaperone Hsp33
MKDYLIKGYVFEGYARLYVANTSLLVEEARQRHHLWPTSAQALGRTLTASVIMGAMYKGDTELTVRIESDGPIGGMVCHTNTYGEVRGYVSNPEVFMKHKDGHLNVGPAVGAGFIHVTKDLKVRDMFTSSSPIISGEIAEDFAYYFTSSEQIPSAVSLGCLINEDESIDFSGGFILQLMPGAKEHHINQIEEVINHMPPMTDLLKDGLSPEEIAKKIDPDIEFLETLDLSFKCNCSKDRFAKALISVGKEELQSMINDDHGAEVTCHFCNNKYTYSESDLETLLKQAK